MNAAPRQEPVHEHEFEAAHGLPERLPANEHILWQGAPGFRALAVRCFHVRTLACYFAAILLVRGLIAGNEGGLMNGLVAIVWLLPPVVLALGMLSLMAWLTSRTSVYTITDRRVVMRVGIVLSLTFNLPYSRILSADARLARGNDGDIALTLADTNQIAYVHLWPHARPWKVRRTEPMLRAVPETARVAQILADAWRSAHGQEGVAVLAPAAAPATTPQPQRPAPAHAPARKPLGQSPATAGLAAR